MNDAAIAAIRAADVGEVKKLLRGGFDPKEPDEKGHPWALALAVLFSSEISRLFIEAGAPVDGVDPFGRTLLFDAKFADLVELLLARGVDPNATSQTPPGVTALMSASEQGRVEIVKLLLDAGADPNTTTPAGGNALLFACDKGHRAIAHLLLDRGAVARGRTLGLAKTHPKLKDDERLIERLTAKPTKKAPAKKAVPKSAALGPYFPGGLEASLLAKKTPAVSQSALLKRLRDEGGSPDPKWGPFLPSGENIRRYGFRLPGAVTSLLDVADRFLIEDVKTPSFRYLRVAPGGWEMPDVVKGEEYAITVAKRFDWNTFSNMQLWEHFSGVMSLGWDPGDNRFAVATTSEDAPVFWLESETAQMHGAIASSLETFLRVELGDDDGVTMLQKKLITSPGIWERDEDGLAYLERRGPLTTWPTFLAARSEWVVACMALGGPEHKDRGPEVYAFDLEAELPFIEKREPLALYWLLRSYYLEERDVFDAVHERASKASPLAASFARLCDGRWNAKAGDSSMATVREALKPEAKRLRKARFDDRFPKSELV